MQCEVSSRHRSPPRGPGWEQRAGPVPVPSRPRGGDTCCHTGWLACPGCRWTLQRTQIIQLMRMQPSNKDHGILSLGVTTKKPRLKPKIGAGQSARRRWTVLDYLVSLQCPPGRCCGQGRLNLLLHHHHLPPLRCLHGTRPALAPGEGSSELAALPANEEGRDGGNGRGTQQGDRMETKMQHPGKRKN